MINNLEDFDLSEAKNFFDAAFDFFDKSEKAIDIEIRYYPYVNVNHTIRVRDGIVYVRISDLFRFATPEAHKSLAIILVAKLLNKKVPKKARETYRRFVNNQEFQEIARQNKKQKGRKIISSPVGKYFDLERLFEKLNLIYFQNEIPRPVLTWSPKRTFRRLGHHDAAHDSITISKSLDDRYVPKFVVEYVLYHEMLHIKHPTQHRNGRRYNHTPAFKRDEENFSYFDEANEWIELNAVKLKRDSKNG